MRLVFMGTPVFAIPALQSLVRAGHEVIAVVTRPDRPRRHAGAWPEPSSVKREAQRLGLAVREPERPGEPAFVAFLHAARPEAIVVVAYGRILPPDVLAIPPRGCINLHGSILPRWRGAAPVARAIMAGDDRTGVSTMMMDRGLDTGDVLSTRECAIGPVETAGELGERLSILGADLLLETLEGLERGTIGRHPQDSSQATLAPPLRREEAVVEWDDPAREVAARVRGCNPWPVACAGLRGRRVQILRAAAIAPDAPDGADAAAPQPGEVVEASHERLLVACGGGTRMRLLELRFPGRSVVGAVDAVNGRLVRPGDRFTTPPV